MEVFDSGGHKFLHTGASLTAVSSGVQDAGPRPNLIPLGTTLVPPGECLRGWKVRVKARPDRSWIAHGPMRTWSGELEVDALELLADAEWVP